MTRNLLAAALAALALTAPAAHADPPQYDCRIAGYQNDTLSGPDHAGVMVGYAVHAEEGGGVPLVCSIRVNGTEEFAAPGQGFVVAPFTFFATDSDDVDVCATVTTNHGPETTCRETTSTQFPPQAVVDLIEDILGLPDRTLLCQALQLVGSFFPDVPGVVEIRGDGDVVLGGALFWDCPPFEV